MTAVFLSTIAKNTHMSLSYQDAEDLAQEANCYNIDGLIEVLTSDTNPDAIKDELLQIYFSLSTLALFTPNVVPSRELASSMKVLEDLIKAFATAASNQPGRLALTLR